MCDQKSNGGLAGATMLGKYSETVRDNPNPRFQQTPIIEEWRRKLQYRIEEVAQISRLIILLERNPEAEEIKTIERELRGY